MTGALLTGAPSSGPLLSAQGVGKRFGRLQVLHGVDMTVDRGEVLAIVGPSGSGKSTFLRCINSLETYDEGRIRVGGELVGYREEAGRLRPLPTREITRQRQRVGMVFQQFNLFWHMTVLENVTEGPIRVQGLPRREAVDRAAALLERVGLGAKLDAYPLKLSGGQQQRAAIARALAMQPALMLFDEPTSALDPETTGEVLSVMAELAASGMTMIVVTHEMGFARRVAHRVAFMDGGRIGFVGEAETFFTAATDERVMRFIASVER
ncbi:amino acid ABC transporter ATP-binding protein [Rubrimonas sp.]|uniref:amino acid ABC transporter ATP-binding protein n=1 Tax=Rubrimonas sp. TaxID=2036015 RepID=UPI002FDE6757